MIRRLVYLALVMSTVSCSQDRSAAESDSPDRPAVATPGSGADAGSPLALAADWAAEYEQMTSVLQLTNAEEARLKAAFVARSDAAARWQQEKGALLAQAQQEMKRAADARDLAAVRRATAAAKPLLAEMRALAESFEGNIIDALPERCRTQWQAHELSVKILGLMQPLGLSDEQIDQVRTAGSAAIVATADDVNPKAAAFMKLEQLVERDVLTAAQQQTYQNIKREHPLRSLM